MTSEKKKSIFSKKLAELDVSIEESAKLNFRQHLRTLSTVLGDLTGDHDALTDADRVGLQQAKDVLESILQNDDKLAYLLLKSSKQEGEAPRVRVTGCTKYFNLIRTPVKLEYVTTFGTKCQKLYPTPTSDGVVGLKLRKDAGREPVLELPPDYTPVYTKPEPRKLPPARPSLRVRQVLDHWSACGLPGHKPDSMSIRKAAKDITDTLDGKMFPGSTFTTEELMRAISNFAMALDPEYEPSSLRAKESLKRVRPKDFFYNAHAMTNRYKSLFLTYLSSPPDKIKAVQRMRADKFPYVTAILEKWVRHTFQKATFSPLEINDLRWTSERLGEFYEEHKAQLRIDSAMQIHGIFDPVGFLARQLIRATESSLRSGESYGQFKTNWLSSDFALGQRLIQFLKQERMML